MKKILIAFATFMSSIIGLDAQILFGTSGLANVPTADMKREGTFVGGATLLPKSYLDSKHPYVGGMYYITLTPLPFVELTFRETLYKARSKYRVDVFFDENGNLVDGDGNFIQENGNVLDADGNLVYKLTPGDNVRYGDYGFNGQDRSYTIRIAPLWWVKADWCPKLVLAATDPWSDNGGSHYSSYYGVLTKHFTFKKIGDFGVSAGYYKPIGDRFGEAEEKSFKGFFGGIGYTPAFLDKMMLSVDYDRKGVTVGTNVCLFNHWNIYGYGRDLKKFGFGMSYQYTIDF